MSFRNDQETLLPYSLQLPETFTLQLHSAKLLWNSNSTHFRGNNNFYYSPSNHGSQNLLEKRPFENESVPYRTGMKVYFHPPCSSSASKLFPTSTPVPHTCVDDLIGHRFHFL